MKKSVKQLKIKNAIFLLIKRNAIIFKVILVKNFSNIYSDNVINKILDENKKRFYYKKAFRVIKNPKSEGMDKKFFYPSIMEYNNYEMPDHYIQDRKTNIQLFGTSCYDSKDNIMSYIESVTSLREAVENNLSFIAEGSVEKEKGFADKAVEEDGPKKGHFNYYIFDPIDNSPVSDFKEIKEANNDE